MVAIFFSLPHCKFFLVVKLVSLKNVNPTSTYNLKMFIYFIGKSLDGQLEMLLRRLEGECLEVNRKEISPNYIVCFKHLYFYCNFFRQCVCFHFHLSLQVS